MKNFVKAFLVFLVISNINSLTNGQGFRIGITSGLNFSKHSEEMKHEEFRYRIGYIGGMFLLYNFNEWIGVQTELLYSMKGNVRVTPVPQSNSESKVFTKLNYIEVPLLIKLSFQLEFPVKPFIIAGPSFSLLQTAEAEAEWPFSSNTTEIDQKDFWKQSEFGIVLGVGGDYEFGLHRIGFNLRYDLGLNNINAGVGGGKINSKTITILLGYSIDI